MNIRLLLAGACLALLAACGREEAGGAEQGTPPPTAAPQKLLYVWAGDLDGKESDFLASIDADPSSAQYGRIIATAPTGFKGTQPHHTEYKTPAGGKLLANGFVGNRTISFDLSNPAQPAAVASFGSVGDGAAAYSYPHSFLRLPDGRIIATFQGRGGVYGAPGGLAEITDEGALVNGVDATAPSADPALAWPYSLDYAPREDRLIVAMSEMGLPGQTSWAETRDVQIHDAKTLSLTGVVTLPPSEKKYDLWPAEPRVAEDGTVFVSTFMCGLYRIDDVATPNPHAALVFEFPQLSEEEACAVPVIIGKFLVQPVPAINGLIAVDISDPHNVKEASRLSFDHSFHMPHWLAADETGRIVVTGMHDSWVLIAKLDRNTGKLSLDEKFRDLGAEKPGVFVGAKPLPHGDSGKAIVHGALFSRN